VLEFIKEKISKIYSLLSTLYNFMTSSLTLVSHEIAKIKIDRESPIVHNLCYSKTKGYDNGLSTTQHFIRSAPFLSTLF